MKESEFFAIEEFQQNIIKKVNQIMLEKDLTLNELCKGINEPVEEIKRQFSFDGVLDIRILGKVLNFLGSEMNILTYPAYPWVNVSKLNFHFSDSEIESGVYELRNIPSRNEPRVVIWNMKTF